MSISSYLYAEHANNMKNNWTNKLREILNSSAADRDSKIKDLLIQMEKFQFSE